MAANSSAPPPASHSPGNHPPGNHQGLGLAGMMARTFIQSPLSPLLLAASLALGILGLFITPRQEDPQISVPMVDVFFGYPGASAEQVASLAVDPLERLMSEISGVKHVYSASQRGQGMVTVEFDVGERMEPSLVKLYDKLMSHRDRIPPGVTEPIVRPKGVDDVPVVTLTLWSQDVEDSSLRLIALDVLQHLKEVPNTSQSFITGGRADQLRVEVYPERLSSYGVSLDQLAATIKGANAERNTGHMEAGDSAFTLRTGSFLRHAADVERLVVGVRKDAPVYVRDVARVIEGPADAQSVVTYYTGPAYPTPPGGTVSGALAPEGASAVTIAVAKKPGTNGVTVSNAVLRQIDYLKGRLIPDNVQVAVTRNYGATANDKVNELVFKLFVATGAVTLLIGLLLGVRAAVVVLIVIPVVILVTVFVAWLTSYTIDRVSLFALIFAIGILVDDAIVVVENIYRRWLEKGSTDVETSVDAVREVGNPTIIATFTVIGALLPMGFVSGMMGPYMRPIPVLGSAAMLFSLFAAFIFTPWLAQHIHPSMAAMHRGQAKEHRQANSIERAFRRILIPLLTNRLLGWSFAAANIIIFLLCCLMFYTTAVTVKMLPLDNKAEFNVQINMPAGASLPVTATLASALATELLKVPEVTALQSYVGTASPFNFNGLVRHTYLRQEPSHADIQVQLVDKGERGRSSHQIAVAVRDALTAIASKAGARIAVIEMPPGPPVLQTVVAEIYGPDANTRRQAARDIERLFAKGQGMVDVDTLMEAPHEEWRFVVDREKAVRQGVSVEDINRQLDMAMGGFKLGDIKIGHVLEPRYIVLEVPMVLRTQFARLGNLPMQAMGGKLIPLVELGRFDKVIADPLVFHKDLRAVEFVTGDVVGRLAAPIYGMLSIEKLLDGYTAPDGVKVKTNYLGPPAESTYTALEWTGEWTVTYETFRDMGLAFAAALVLIYMLVVWEFGNFTLPAIIMVPIPLTLMGIIPGHWLLNAEFTATSMIGFIALAGIIVRNSILLVDFSKHAIESGVDVQEAVIQACRTRTRPILITAMALVLGSSVILSDPIFQGMAISLMFGTLVSTILTLVIIPLGCVSARGAFAGATGVPDPVSCPPEDEDDEDKAPLIERIKAGAMMAGYLLRALPVFFGMFVQEIKGKLAARFQRPEPPPAPSPPPPPPPPPPAPPTAPSPTPPSPTPPSPTVSRDDAEAATEAAQAPPPRVRKPAATLEAEPAATVVESAPAPVPPASPTKPKRVRKPAAAKAKPIAAAPVASREPAGEDAVPPESPPLPAAEGKGPARGARRGIRLKTPANPAPPSDPEAEK